MVARPAAAAEALIRKRWRDLSLAEVSGSLGDLGTFLPILLSLAAFGVVQFSPALFWAGLFNFVTGILWDCPMPVQPMKTIAAVALASGDPSSPGLSAQEAMGAGVSVSIIVLVLGATGLVDVVNWLIPVSVVRGLQVGLGLSMVSGGLRLIAPLPFTGQADCALLALAATLFVLSTSALKLERRVPSALVLAIVGFTVASVRVSREGADTFTWRPALPPVYVGSTLEWSDVLSGFLKAGLAQLPLTTLNSVVSVVDLNNRALFPHDPAKHITRRSVATSVAVMNLSGIWFGAMPMCHGAGGLAAQYRFGARSGAALLVLGAAKMLLAALLGADGDVVLQAFPKSILAVLLVFAGLSLAMAGLTKALEPTRPELPSRRELSPADVLANERANQSRLFVMLATAAVTVSRKTGWGFVAGVTTSLFMGQYAHVGRDLQTWRAKLRARRATAGHAPLSSPPSPPAAPSFNVGDMAVPPPASARMQGARAASFAAVDSQSHQDSGCVADDPSSSSTSISAVPAVEDGLPCQAAPPPHAPERRAHGGVVQPASAASKAMLPT